MKFTKVIRISGKSWDAAVASSEVPREEGWPAGTYVKVGRGVQYQLPWSDDLAEKVASHFEEVGSNFVMFGVVEDRPEGRALLRDAARIRKAMAT